MQRSPRKICVIFEDPCRRVLWFPTLAYRPGPQYFVVLGTAKTDSLAVPLKILLRLDERGRAAVLSADGLAEREERIYRYGFAKPGEDFPRFLADAAQLPPSERRNWDHRLKEWFQENDLGRFPLEECPLLRVVPRLDVGKAANIRSF